MGSMAQQPDKASKGKRTKRTPPRSKPKAHGRGVQYARASISRETMARVLAAHAGVLEALEHDHRAPGTHDALRSLHDAGLDAARALLGVADDDGVWAALEAGAAEPLDVELVSSYAHGNVPWLLDRVGYAPPPSADALVAEALDAIHEATTIGSDAGRAAALVEARARLRHVAAELDRLLPLVALRKPRRRLRKQTRRVLWGVAGLLGAVGGAVVGLETVGLVEQLVGHGLAPTAEEAIKAAGQYGGAATGVIVQRRWQGRGDERGLSEELAALGAELDALDDSDLRPTKARRHGERGRSILARLEGVVSADSGMTLAIDDVATELADTVRSAVARDGEEARWHASQSRIALAALYGEAAARLRER